MVIGLMGALTLDRNFPFVPILPIVPISPTRNTSISEINFLLEVVRCGASKKGLPEDSTSSTASGSQLFKHVPQIATYHKKFAQRPCKLQYSYTAVTLAAPT